MKNTITLVSMIFLLGLSGAAKPQSLEGWDSKKIAEVEGYCISGIVGAAKEGVAINNRENGTSKPFPEKTVVPPVKKLCRCFGLTASEQVTFERFRAETLFIKTFNDSIDNGTCKPEGILKVMLDRFGSGKSRSE